MHDAYILAGVRTPIGKFLGGLSSLAAPELGALVIREALQRANIAPDRVEDVIMGEILTAGVGQAPARQAALKAGLPPTVSALTINKMCGSGLQAVMLAAQAIRAGDASIVVAGGMESMSRAPHILKGAREGLKYGDAKLEDSMILDGLWCSLENCHMGSHADYTAEHWKVSRADQDQFAVSSHAAAVAATRDGKFQSEILPIKVKVKRDEIVIQQDEGPRPETDIASLSRLKPAFNADGTVTAGNASSLSDGAAALVVTDLTTAESSAAPWRARIVAYHTSGVAPRDIFIAPVEAVRGVLRKARLQAKDIDLFELNEAFASQMLACARELQLDPEKINVHGGAIALGHPIGASGARVLVTLLSALHQRGLKRGMASLCLGGGNAVALIVEL
ncbi:MAG: acetyl-CoA acetyltransferase [Planctomycetaceae bacterium]|nr:acetyl-CoA acetyltransferase [Planctomycetaceae bacterium]